MDFSQKRNIEKYVWSHFENTKKKLLHLILIYISDEYYSQC